jgi:Dehydrogenases with different specificities (related to short-chain alcohol dehydrogenases)
VVSLNLVAARELASIGVRVNTIAPGIFGTPMLLALGDEVVQSLTETAIFPKRLGNPEEFAMMVETCFTNPMLNGAVIRLDGALRMMP